VKLPRWSAGVVLKQTPEDEYVTDRQALIAQVTLGSTSLSECAPPAGSAGQGAGIQVRVKVTRPIGSDLTGRETLDLGSNAILHVLKMCTGRHPCRDW
jgi:hypothetical protein